MPTESIFHNFVVSDKKSVETILNVIENPQNNPVVSEGVSYEEIRDPAEVKEFTEKWHNSQKES